MDRLNMDDLYYTMFLEETQEQIDKIEQELLLLENGRTDMDTINSIFRMAHSIKGAAATMGFETMTMLSHHLESILSKVREKEISIDTMVMTIFFQSIDSLKEIHLRIQNREDYNIDISNILDNMKHVMDQHDRLAMDNPEQEDPVNQLVMNQQMEENDLELDATEKRLCHPVDSKYHIYKILIMLDKTTRMKSVKTFLVINNLQGIGDIIAVTPDNFEHISDDDFGDVVKVILATEREYEAICKNINSISEIQHVYIKKVREAKEEKNYVSENVKVVGNTPRKEEKSTVRVDVSKIDKLLNLVGEFIIDKENINQIGAQLKKQYKNDPLIRKLVNILPHINFIGSELQETVMSTRMLPLEHIFNRFPRMARDLAKKCNKEMDFVMEGQETEIDRGIIEELIDPLTHILRNAIDHGLEDAAERQRGGKNPAGTLKLMAKHQESNVVIVIEDDGRGMDVNRIKNKVLEKGLATQEQIKNQSDMDLLQYIFEPGFSTAKEISDISGRGVGLDVVRSNIRKLNGMVDIKTELGKGTKFIIKLPLTLAIVQALLIKEGEYTFALPIASVIEILRVKDGEIQEGIHAVGEWEVFNWRDQTLPLIRVGRYFGVNEQDRSNKLFIVVVGYGERKIALVVDKLVGEQEIVIKSIGDFLGENRLFGNLRGISGVSILGDGSFAQIMDITFIGKRLGG